MHDVKDEEEDEWVDELPPLGELSKDDEGFADDVWSPEELDGLPSAGGGEDVGLDDSTGLDDDTPLFNLDLPPAEVVDEDAVDVIPLVDDLDEGEEYGWTQDAGSAEDERWDPLDHDLPDLTPLGRDATGGEEGVDHDFELGGGDDDDAVPNLPPLQGLLDDDDEEELELDVDPRTEREFARILQRAVHELPPLIDGVHHEVVIEGQVRDAAFGEVIWVAGPAGVRRGPEPVTAQGLVGAPVSIAVALDDSWLLVGTDRGVHRSVDAGRTFRPVEGLGTGGVSFAQESEGAVWALGPTGRVQRSDDGGATWSPPLLLTRVVAISSPGQGIVTLSAPAAARPQLAASTDGGRRWTACDAPTLSQPDEDGAYSLAATGDDAAVASSADAGGPFLSEDRGRSWTLLPGLPPARALAVRREPALTLYAAHESESGTAVARYLPVRDSASGVIYEGTSRVWAIFLQPDGAILLATDAGLIRVHIEGAS